MYQNKFTRDRYDTLNNKAIILTYVTLGSASAGVTICLANLAKDQNFLYPNEKLFSHFLGQKLTRYEDKCQYK